MYKLLTELMIHNEQYVRSLICNAPVVGCSKIIIAC